MKLFCKLELIRQTVSDTAFLHDEVCKIILYL